MTMTDAENTSPDVEDSVPMPAGTRVYYFGPDVALLDLPEPEARLPPALTGAEEDIALRVFEGATNREIAEARGVSIKTIGNQLASIYRKLGVASRTELVLLLRHVP